MPCYSEYVMKSFKTSDKNYYIRHYIEIKKDLKVKYFIRFSFLMYNQSIYEKLRSFYYESGKS